MTHSEVAPLVSAIIPVHNGERFLAEAIESILSQTCGRLEVLVVDDGSTDGTSEVLKQYRAAVRSLRTDNKGPAAARNVGIREARSDLLAFLDHDDLWAPEKIELQLAALRNSPQAAVAFSDTAIFDQGGIVTPSQKKRVDFVPCSRIFSQLLNKHCIALSSTLIRRRALDRVGLFDESLLGAEDLNLLMRLALEYDFAFVDRVLVYKRSHENNLSERLNEMLRDELANLEKIAALAPALVPRRKLAAQAYARFGKQYFTRGAPGSARMCFGRALLRQPWQLEAWLFYAALALPEGLRRRLILLRRQWRNVPRPASEQGSA